jgi:hypothetical protein
MKRTFNFPVFTNILVFGDVLKGETAKTAILSVNARVGQSAGNIFQSHIPDP